MTEHVKLAAHPYGYTAVVAEGDLYRAAEQIFSDLGIGCSLRSSSMRCTSGAGSGSSLPSGRSTR